MAKVHGRWSEDDHPGELVPSFASCLLLLKGRKHQQHGQYLIPNRKLRIHAHELSPVNRFAVPNPRGACGFGVPWECGAPIPLRAILRGST